MTDYKNELKPILGSIIQLWESYCDEKNSLEQYPDIDSFLRHSKLDPKLKSLEALLSQHSKKREQAAYIDGCTDCWEDFATKVDPEKLDSIERDKVIKAYKHMTEFVDKLTNKGGQL